jgi:hypothetical protein
MRSLNRRLNETIVCQPDDVTADQLIAIVKKYLRDHPDQLHKTAAELIFNAYAKAFPCKKNSN